MWVLLGVILWVIIAFWPAIIARRKGHSFFGWLIVSVFFWWITLFVVFFVLKDKTKTARDIADDKAAEAALERDEKKS